MPNASEVALFRYKCFLLYDLLTSASEKDEEVMPDYVFENLIAQSAHIIGVQ